MQQLGEEPQGADGQGQQQATNVMAPLYLLTLGPGRSLACLCHFTGQGQEQMPLYTHSGLSYLELLSPTQVASPGKFLLPSEGYLSTILDCDF